MPGRFLRIMRPFTVFTAAGVIAACFFLQANATGSKLAPGNTPASKGAGGVIVTPNPLGKLGTVSANGFDAGATESFFHPLGSNGRSCVTCHLAEDAYTITPATAKSVARRNPQDPLFDSADGGTNCPPVFPQMPDARYSSMLLKYALIRELIAIPSGANFSLVSATNPHRCQITPGSPAISGKLILFRRPLPSANLTFLSDVRWDARETVKPIATGKNLTNLESLVFDLSSQGNKASIGHELSPPILGSQALADIVAFERNLYTAQLTLKPLKDLGERAGPGYLAKTIAPGFFIGQNDPLGKNFSSAVFTLFSDWEPDHTQNGNHSSSGPPNDLQRAIGLGEKIFNSRPFLIANVQGLNSAKNDPLYNPADPLAGRPIVGTCSTCHNTPDVGSHSTSLPLNTGVASAVPLNNAGQPIPSILDIALLPVYTLKSSKGAAVRVTDPGRALISGQWTDVGKMKVPVLRGLAARAPYFHNGSAKDLAAVIAFYNARFNIGLTQEESRALELFLSAL